MRRGVEAFGLAGSVQRIGRVHLVRKDGVWQSRSGEVSFGEVWLGRFALERIGLDRQVRDRNGKAGSVQRRGLVWSGVVGQSRWGKLRRETVRSVLVRQQRQGLYSRGMVWCDKAVMVLSGVDG